MRNLPAALPVLENSARTMLEHRADLRAFPETLEVLEATGDDLAIAIARLGRLERSAEVGLLREIGRARLALERGEAFDLSEALTLSLVLDS